MQLMESLESRNAQFSAIVAEKEKLTSENQQLKANEEALHCLLREKHKENTELQQDYDRQCQHLKNVAAFVVVSGTVYGCSYIRDYTIYMLHVGCIII